MSDQTTTSPPELKTLRLSAEGEIATLTLDRPDELNAMSPEMIEELMIAAAWLADRAPYRALIVTGSLTWTSGSSMRSSLPLDMVCTPGWRVDGVRVLPATNGEHACSRSLSAPRASSRPRSASGAWV